MSLSPATLFPAAQRAAWWLALVLLVFVALTPAPLAAQKIEDPDVVHNRMLQHEQDAEARIKSKDYTTALASLALALRDADTLKPTYVDHAEYGPLYRELSAYYKDRIAGVYMMMNENGRALAMLEKAAPEYDSLLAAKNTLELRERTSVVYGRLSYQQLLANRPADAENSARRALRLDPTQLWIKTNLAHGMLLTGEVQEAMAIYKAEQNSSLGDADERTFGQAVLDDFKELEAAGVKSPLFDQVRKLYGVPSPAQTSPAPTASATPPAIAPPPSEPAVGTPPPSPTPPTASGPAPMVSPPAPAPSTAGNNGDVLHAAKSWMNVIIVAAIALVVFVFVAVVAVTIIIVNRRRTGALKEMVHSMGWTFRSHSTSADDQLISSSELSMRGTGRRLSNFIELPPGPGQPLIFDFQFSEGGGKNSHTHIQTICCFQDERTRLLPHFLLRPEHLGDKLGSLFGGKDINFPSHPDFNRKYLLRGMNETSIRQYFSEAILSHFDRDLGWTVEAVSGRLFVYRLDQRIKPQDLQAFIDSRRKILAVITAPVTSSAAPPLTPPSQVNVPAEPSSLDGEVTVRSPQPPPLPS